MIKTTRIATKRVFRNRTPPPTRITSPISSYKSRIIGDTRCSRSFFL